MTVALHRNALALEVRGHGKPLYVAAGDVRALTHDRQAVELSRLEHGDVVRAGVAFPTGDGMVVVRPGMETAEAFYGARAADVGLVVAGLKEKIQLSEVTV